MQASRVSYNRPGQDAHVTRARADPSPEPLADAVIAISSLAELLALYPISCHNHHMAALFPIESEFATTEQAEAYDRWFRAKIQASLDDTRPGIPHGQVMAEMDAIIAELEQRRPRQA